MVRILVFACDPARIKMTPEKHAAQVGREKDDHMSAEYNRKLAHDLMKAWSIDIGGDIEPYMALFSDDAVLEPMANSELFPQLKGPWSKQHWRDYLIAELKMFPIRFIVTGVTADEDRVAIEAMGDVNINGHLYNNRYHFLVEVRDGKVSKLRFYMDTLYAKQALGWIEEAFAAAKQ